jgi:iron complex transport system substrate-binding protein
MTRVGLVAVLGATLTCPLLAQPVKVEDQRGKTIELAAPAERIITIPIPMAAVIMALDGSSKRLVGIHPQARKSIADGFLKRVFPEALEITADVVRGGQFNPNLESILGLRPDLVVQWTEPADLIASLERAGLRVAGLFNDPPTQEVNERNLTIVGELIGRGDRIRALLTRHRETQTRIAAVAAAIPQDKRPRALYFREFGMTMRPAGSNNYRDYAISLSGGRNAAADLKGMSAAVNVEQIIRWNPDVILLGAFDDSTPHMVSSAPELAGIEAVKNRRVYKMPHGGYRWDPGSHESFLAWQWASMLLHPNRFDFDLRSDMRRSYEFFYNYKLGDSEIDDILRMDVNSDMAAYARFKK